MRQRPGLQSLAPQMGGRTHLRLDDPLAPSRPRLRAAPRRLRSHDPHRHGQRPPTQERSPMISKRTLSATMDERLTKIYSASVRAFQFVTAVHGVSLDAVGGDYYLGERNRLFGI